jgi:hypothetical protein
MNGNSEPDIESIQSDEVKTMTIKNNNSEEIRNFERAANSGDSSSYASVNYCL